MILIKKDGTKEQFQSDKIRKWIRWAVPDLSQQFEMEYEILTQTLKRLPEVVTTTDIHETLIRVCLDKEDISYARVAANLEKATILKAQQSELGLMNPNHLTFSEYLEIMIDKGIWDGSWIYETKLTVDSNLLDEWYIELEAINLEYPTIKQFSDKYSQKYNDKAIETPALGMLALAISLHGVTPLAFQLAKAILLGKINLPTPALNGCRNGDFNSISCCVIEGSDTTNSLEVASHVASVMTGKKAGIGITLDCRSHGDPVKNGQVKHLGKAPLFRAIESQVKKFTQLTRGGSATVTIKAIDPDIMNMLLWKTQKIDLSQRIDKIDYSFAYNDCFVDALLNGEDWYLFSRIDAPEVHENFHSDDYKSFVKQALLDGVKHTKVKALDVLLAFIDSRWEHGRMYCINLTRANDHTPFNDTITQSNLCLEIALPTKGYADMQDLYSDRSKGEVAFCSLAAHNVAKISPEEYLEISEISLRTVDAMLVAASKFAMSPSMRRNLLSRRSVGIGITGLASYIYQNGLDYDGSEESLELVESLAELHYYSLLKASQKMSEETGFQVQGIKKDWLPIDTMHTYREPLLDWESLRGKPRMHSVLVAHMPTESSAVFSNATNGLYPSRERVVYKAARKGRVQFISEYFDPKVNKTAYQVDMVPYYQAVQNYTDQAISADYYTDFSKYPNRKVPDIECIEWFVKQAKAGVKTAYYQNFLDTSGEEIEQEDSCGPEGGCKL